MRIPSVVAAWIRHVRVVRTGWHLTVDITLLKNAKFHGGFKKWIPIFTPFQILYELEKKSSLVTRALSAKSCTRDTDSLHSCTRLRLVQEMACPYHACKIWPRKHSYPNLIPIKPLSQLAHDHCKTLCDPAFWHSHDGSPTLHERSLPCMRFSARLRSRLIFEHVWNSEATVCDAFYRTGSHDR